MPLLLWISPQEVNPATASDRQPVLSNLIGCGEEVRQNTPVNLSRWQRIV